MLASEAQELGMPTGRVVWITGLSGAGKTTLARELLPHLRNGRHEVVMLDGDELREVLGAETVNASNHDREARLRLAMRYARLCRMLASQGLTVVIATISLFQEVHRWNRAHLPGYFEVYLRVPLDELRRRDPKGIYARFDAGLAQHVAGLDLTIDEPELPDLVIDHAPTLSPDASVARVMTAITGLIEEPPTK